MSAQSAIYNPSQTTSAATGDGFSVPRLTTTGRLAITFGTADAGMMVYDTTLNNLFIWTGSAWESVPASGDAGANGSVQYNDNGVVSGASNFFWDKANNRVGIGTASPSYILDIIGASPRLHLGDTGTGFSLLDIQNGAGTFYVGRENSVGSGGLSGVPYAGILYLQGAYPIICGTNFTERYRIASDGVATWSNVGGVAGTAMTLNSTGLGVGASPGERLTIQTALTGTTVGSNTVGRFQSNGSGYDAHIALGDNVNPSARIGYLSSAMYFWTNGAERVRIDSSGNVGIGVTPSSWSLGKALNVNSLDGAVLWGYSGAAVFGNNFRFSGGYLYETTAAASRYSQSSGSHQWFNAPSGTAGNAITFTQAMTLDASGNLLVGTTSNPNSSRAAVKTASVTSALSLNSVTGDTAQELFVINKFDSDSTTSQVFARFTNNNGAAGSGQINGNGANACAFGSFSDARLKENIVSLPSQLANILSLRPVEFDYKDGSGHQIGFVAQEIQEVYADTVAEQNGFLTVTGWSKTEARLVSAIKELAAKVQALEAKLA